MRLTLPKQQLQKELAFLAGIIETKSTIPILQSVLIEATGADSVKLSATDLDVSMTTSCDTEVAQAGAICIPGKKLFEIVRQAPGESIEIAVDGDHATIKAQKSRSKLLCAPRENFPEIASPKGEQIAINGTLWNEMVRRVVFAITAEESRYALNGAKLEIASGKLRLVATDGHQMAFIEQFGEYGAATVDCLIPKKAMAESAKLAEGVSFGLVVDDNHLHFLAGKRTLTSRKLSGQFPNYEMVLPKENTNIATVEAASLLAGVRRCALMADERSKAIRVTFTEEQISIAAQSSESGEAADVVSCDYAGPEIVVGFNAQYVADVLALTDLGQMEIRMKDGNSQVELGVKDEKRFTGRYVIMPMKI